MKAAFLDRDGVINKERGVHTFRQEDFEILPGVAEGVRLLKERGFLTIIISNQSGIALGMYSHADVIKLHQILQARLKPQGTAIDDFYYCPHHPAIGRCLCRKPGSLLIEKAVAKYNIDPAQSVLFGDKARDTEAAEKAGVKGYLVQPNQDLRASLAGHIL